jgi:hypothetical protein
MRIIPLFILTLLIALSINSRSFAASLHPSIVPPPEHLKTEAAAFKMKMFLSLTPKKYQQLTGKKLSMKQRIGLRIFQWTEKNHLLTAGEPTVKQKKYAMVSLIFGAASILPFIFIPPPFTIIALPLAIVGLIYGKKSVKGNTTTAGVLGLVFSLLTLLVFVLLTLAIIIAALTSGIK